MPYCHAIATIANRNERPETFCHGWLTMESYQKTYANHVEAVERDEYWVHTD